MHTLRNTKLAIFVGLLPSLIIYIGVAIIPILFSLYYSFFNWDGISPKIFIGFENFVDIFKDDIFWLSLKNNVVIMITGLIGQIPLGLALALLLNKGLKGNGFFRTVGFLPVVVSSVMVSLIWGMIYNTEYGFLNGILGVIGLESWQKNWLGDPDWSMLSISLAYIWQNCGLYMIIFLAALQNISSEVNEAAELDGARGLRKVFTITIPIIRPTILVTIIFSISNSFRVFDLIQILTGGGPAHQTEVMTIYMYNNAFVSRQFGYGSAVSILILLFSFIVVVIANRVGREKN
ncbi:MAG: sugar ABC transporter permease [Candidatus Pristimantibacillus lignocellulolyticus]|uniref:Sugar ABC transporter permease n=1 Tax=Candidatus Pristimantibacillus lignocellulolyticus TaxID=2994561 RepID=A0A9J6ZD40_9BACL|nr:MAG: sugar ABC transporter permease [Candidatus Pristimantibacillus lignocellulolyticus]